MINLNLESKLTGDGRDERSTHFSVHSFNYID